MSETCSSNCTSCSSNCSSTQPSKKDFLVKANSSSNITKVIGVVSGKGGVGKSFVTSYLAVLFQRKGYRTAILDADITGPSIPKVFGLKDKLTATETGINPAITKNGIKVMSVNLILQEEEIPVLWRGPVIAGTVKQFWSEVNWGEVDYMFIDMPPGTGDVPLTVFQSIPLDGIIVVTSPQQLVSIIVSKAINMANTMQIPILGFIENYSYLSCPHCNKKISLFGESHIDDIAKKYNLQIIGNLPIDSTISIASDKGEIEQLSGEWLDYAMQYILDKTSQNKIKDRNKADTLNVAIPIEKDNTIFQHFGKSETFSIFHIIDDIIVNRTTLKANGSGHSELVSLLQENGIHVLICGGIGTHAIEELLEKNIATIPGMSGKVEEVIQNYLIGDMTCSNTATCTHNEPGQSCGDNCNCH